jgi:hypothetical protein
LIRLLANIFTKEGLKLLAISGGIGILIGMGIGVIGFYLIIEAMANCPK